MGCFLSSSVAPPQKAAARSPPVATVQPAVVISLGPQAAPATSSTTGKTGLGFLDNAIVGAATSVTARTGKTPEEWLSQADHAVRGSVASLTSSMQEQMEKALARSDNAKINSLLDSALASKVLESHRAPAAIRQAANQTARRQLQEAIDAADPKRLKGALVAAKRLCATNLPEFGAAVRKYQEVRKLPPGWDVSRMVLHRQGARMVAKIEIDDPKIMASLQTLLDRTHRKVYTRDRMGEAVPDRLELVRATLVTNDDLWGDFATRREAIRQSLEADPSDFVEYKTDTVASMEPVTDGAETTEEIAAALAAQLGEPMLPSVNETLLFHGTNANAAGIITTEDFRINLAGSHAGTLYGRGVYFAENASKSDEYTSASADGLRHMLLCRVVLGRAMYNDQKDTDPRACEDACLRGKFHSVLGDRKKCRGTFREFIIFDEEQVYPSFILVYRRVEGKVDPSEKAECMVVCPAGATPGTLLQLKVPSGATIQVTVPPGISPGQQFKIQY
mmetsp:Transcript_40716/g.117867  ORF Transcript_40716/g.117867 Transcript_40716/m.117867 type:complete len:505 (-) Transcript_40716:135-1649(-)